MSKVSTLNSRLGQRRNLVLGFSILAVLLVFGASSIDGFLSVTNLRSMLLLAAFLGLASIGQTFTALVGGLDLSIAYVIGAANILMVFLMQMGISAPVAVVMIVVFGLLVGIVNGLLSLRLQNQSLVVTLGVGFIVVGLAQILVSFGEETTSQTGAIPEWISNASSVNGQTFGLPITPIVLFWVVISAVIGLAVKHTWFGRSLYALGGNRNAARLVRVSERQRWISVYAISGAFAATTGIALLGFSGGSFVQVGNDYLFLTVVAVTVGGTSLLGGRGGYGSTVLGVLIVIVLQSLLVGLGYNSNAQQFILGLLIIPLVGLYARNPSLRNQI